MKLKIDNLTGEFGERILIDDYIVKFNCPSCHEDRRYEITQDSIKEYSSINKRNTIYMCCDVCDIPIHLEAKFVLVLDNIKIKRGD